MRVYFLFIILIFSLVNGCQISNNDQTQQSLTVSAAVSLKDAFQEIGKLYESKSGKRINFNFGASGALQRQIETGAPVDLFASAGERQLDELAEKNLIVAGTRSNFARNSLVLIVPLESKFKLADFSELSQTQIQKIAVGNPKTVPAGQYTAQVFEKLNLTGTLKNKLIIAEDVRQVLDYVVRGEVDAGVVYATDARIAGEKIRVVATAEENTHEPILYPLAVIKDSANKKGAGEFAQFVLSPAGQKILNKYGFATNVSGQ